MKQLIVNADDLGYTPGVNRAILEAHRRGIVTSASLLANGPSFADAVEQAKLEPGLDVGCHLNFVEGAPVSPPGRIPHLVGADGKFHALLGLGMRLLGGAVPSVEIERESCAQIEKLLQAGLPPSHVDTHQHTHLHPLVAAALARAAREFAIRWVRRPFENCTPAGIPGAWFRRMAGLGLNFFAAPFERRMAARGLRLPDSFSGLVLTGRLTKRALEETLAALPPGVTELVCHPGYCDAELESSPTRLKRQREAELEAVADGAWRAKLAERGIFLTSFRDALCEPGQAARNPVPALALPARGE